MTMRDELRALVERIKIEHITRPVDGVSIVEAVDRIETFLDEYRDDGWVLASERLPELRGPRDGWFVCQAEGFSAGSSGTPVFWTSTHPSNFARRGFTHWNETYKRPPPPNVEGG